MMVTTLISNHKRQRSVRTRLNKIGGKFCLININNLSILLFRYIIKNKNGVIDLHYLWKNLLIVAILGGILFTGACSPDEGSGSSGDKTVLKLGTKVQESSAEGKAFQYFSDLVKEKSAGDLEVEVYPSEQLGGADTQVSNVEGGAQDMYAEGGTIFSDFDDRLDLAAIPFLWKDYDQYHRYMTEVAGEDINKHLIEQGVRIINTDRSFRRGPSSVLMSKEPVKTLDDMKGLKLRAIDSDIFINGFKQLGANPTVVDFTETYLGLQQNVVEGVTNPISLVDDMSFYEVAPYMTKLDHKPADVIIVMNEDNFQNLSEKEQNILVDAANEAGVKGTELVKEDADEAIEQMKENDELDGIYDIDKEEWREELLPFYQDLEEEGELPEGLLDKINSDEIE